MVANKIRGISRLIRAKQFVLLDVNRKGVVESLGEGTVDDMELAITVSVVSGRLSNIMGDLAEDLSKSKPEVEQLEAVRNAVDKTTGASDGGN